MSIGVTTKRSAWIFRCLVVGLGLVGGVAGNTAMAVTPQVSAGGAHTLALKADGTVWAWGSNAAGQLGTGGTSASLVPVPVAGLSDVTEIARGENHTLALTIDGTVWAWGFNSSGQLGNNSTTVSLVPVPVAGLGNVVAVSGGQNHTLALKADGTVWSWGANSWGQLGNGSTLSSSVPVPVAGLSNVIAVAGGDNHTLALNANGTVWAWGANFYGELGASGTSLSLVPVPVAGLGNVVAVAAGQNRSLVLKADGTVWSWGNNSTGQLGNDSNTNSSVPVPAAGLGNVVAVSGGQNHTLALKADGTVWSWGANSWGQLGNNSTVSSRVPVPVAGLNNVIAVSGGFLHSLALKSDGTVWAWGQGLNGRLGINSTGNRTVPVQVKGPAGVGVLNLGPSGSQPGTLVLSNDTPIWDNAPPAGPSTQLRWTVSSGATSYEVFRNGTKIYPTSGTYSGLSFRNELGLTAGQTYTYQIVASNPAGTRQSNTVVVGPMPGAPVAPTISSVLPAAIPQGNGYQDVTLTGSGLTGASWHEFSTDGGATWVPAESSPVVNSSTSITVGVNNTIVRTVRIRVCAAYGSALCSSGSVPVAIQAAATPIAPTVSSGIPNAIPQGSGTQNVTLSGTAFSATSRLQQSTNGGADWAWSASVPAVTSGTSMTVAVGNTVAGTVKIRVCAFQGSSACSAGYPIVVQGGALPTPVLGSVSPTAVLQGVGPRLVTLVGGGITPATWPETSVDGGDTWTPQPTAPTFPSDSSIVATVNTSVATVLVRLCSSYDSSSCSEEKSVSIAPLASLTGLVTRCPAGGCQPTTATRAIVITHGWNSNAFNWVKEMALATCGRLASAQTYPFAEDSNSLTLVCWNDLWHVWILDWKGQAYAPSFPEALPWSAWANAESVGIELGLKLGLLSSYQHYHLIAHSAGSRVIDKATEVLGSNPDIHLTFLDAFDPSASMSPSSLLRHESNYGENADWVDNYVDTRLLGFEVLAVTPPDDIPEVLVKLEQLDTSDLLLPNGFNIDVNGNSLNPTCLTDCRHSRPYRFYGKSLNLGFADDPLDPIPSAGAPPSVGVMGFPRSLEGGSSMNALESSKGRECRMQGDTTCVDTSWTPGFFTYFPGAIKESATTLVAGEVDLVLRAANLGATIAGRVFDSAKLATLAILPGLPASRAQAQLGSAVGDQPSYMKLQVTTTSPVNILKFDWGFGPAGQGLLQVFFDGEVVGQRDQQFVPQASPESEELYIGGANGTVPPGTHELAFRLDGFGTSPSDVEITNVELLLRRSVDSNGYIVTPTAGTGGTVEVNVPQYVTAGATASFTVAAGPGYVPGSSVGGSCPQGSWSGNVWTTGPVNFDCSVTFSFVAPDDDGDGVANLLDNCRLAPNANQCDSDGDRYGNACDGDLNNNGFVNAQDTILFRAQLGQPSVPPTYNYADLNCNGFVNAQDTVILRNRLGVAVGPSGLLQ